MKQHAAWRSPRPWMAFLLEGLTLVLLVTVFHEMHKAWGWTGLVISELSFLALAVGAALFHKMPLRQVFPLRRVSLREALGVAVLTAAGVQLSMLSAGLSLFIAPGSVKELQALGDFICSGKSLAGLIFVMAVLPAVCEEALHRGALLMYLRGVKKDWLIILILGVFFGLSHLSVSKFLSTAILGGLMGCLAVKKNNLALSILMHFLNNLFSVSGVFLGGGSNAAQSLQAVPVTQLLGGYCVLGSSAPLLLVLALRLLFPAPPHQRRRWALAALGSAALLAAGLVCVGLGMNESL